MRILHVIEILDPDKGGPQAVATRLAAAQAAFGHDVTIACYHAPAAAGGRIASLVDAIPGWPRVRRVELPPPTKWQRVVPRSARRLLDPAVASSDVVHLHGVWESLLRGAADAARARGVPYVLTPHSLLDPWALAQKSLKKRVALALGYRRMLNGAAALHALNADERDRMTPLGLTPDVYVIGNGVFLEEFDHLPDRRAFGERHPAVGDRPYVLFLSRLHFKKGLDVLADAFGLMAPRVPDAQLVVAGPDDGARASFEAQVRSAKLQSRVHLVGPLYGADKLAALAGAACFCLPSRMEGFSVAITEAMACRLPVVISQGCHFPEVADQGAGEVLPLTAEAFADGLGRLLTDPVGRSRMGDNGRRLVEQRYTWPRVADAILDMYGRLGGGDGGGGGGGGGAQAARGASAFGMGR
jgi:glycosyltransferase involved in cell wall biosynthesis